MKKVTRFIVLATSLALLGCNAHVKKEDILVRIGESPVVQSEYDLILSTIPLDKRQDPDIRKKVFQNIFDARLLAEAAIVAVPQASNYVKTSLQNLLERDLAQMYTTMFLSVQLGYTEAELKFWYNSNRGLFKDSTSDFILLREEIAKKKLLSKEGDKALLSYYHAHQSDFKLDSAVQPFEKVRPQVENAFVESFRRKLLEENMGKLKAKYPIVYAEIPEINDREFYNKNPQEFKTKAAWKLKVAESEDSLSLNSITDFSGKTIYVKEGHCLPEFGMLPALFEQLQGQVKGYKTPVIRANDLGKWVRFEVVEYLAPTIKSYERVSKEIKIKKEMGEELALDTNTVLVTYQGKPFIKESHIQAIKKEIPPQQRRIYNRAKILETKLEWLLNGFEAKSLKLDESNMFRALINIRKSDLWASVYKDSIQNRTLGYSSLQLKSVIDANPHGIFAGRDSASILRDAALWLDLPDQAYQLEYYLNPARYTSAKSWQDAKPDIFRRLRDNSMRSAQNRLRFKLLEQFKVQVVDTNYKSMLAINKHDLNSHAKRMYEERKLSDARNTYQMILDVYPADTLAFRARMMLANILNEEESYSQARNEYLVAQSLWPNHPDAYKALFMQAFIETENLKQDSLAIKTFKKLLELYPQNKMAADADWMVRNIESGGKLVPGIIEESKP